MQLLEITYVQVFSVWDPTKTEWMFKLINLNNYYLMIF